MLVLLGFKHYFDIRDITMYTVINEALRNLVDADIGRNRKENIFMFKLLGYRYLQFTNKERELIKGLNIYTAYKHPDVEGFCVQKFFLKDGISLPEGVKLNDTIKIHFNMNGKVEMISKA